MTPIPTELRELLERIVAGDVGRMIYAKLATGQATETDDGKAWLELRALLATPPADAADMGGQAGEEVEVRGLQWLDTGHYRKKPPQFGYNPHDWNPLMTVAQHERIVAALSAQDDEYPPCDYCHRELVYHPWHGSGLFQGVESRHIHACDECRHLLPSAHVSVPRELLERVESHLDRTTFAPFGEPLPPDNTERRELRDNIRALLNGGEA